MRTDLKASIVLPEGGVHELDLKLPGIPRVGDLLLFNVDKELDIPWSEELSTFEVVDVTWQLHGPIVITLQWERDG